MTVVPRDRPMSFLDSTPHPYSHPFGIYVRHLRRGTSVSWFSPSASVNDLRDHLWELMDLRHEDLEHGAQGFAETSAGSVYFVAATSGHGSVITCFPLDNAGVALINRALADGSRANHALVESGVDANDSGVFDYINGASIARLDA
jgi:hypothetical protein